MKIKVGEYVRTKTGEIAKIEECYGKDIGYKNQEHYETDVMVTQFNNFILYKEDIKAHSPNIIDLIEVGDVIKYKECFETEANEPNILNLRSQKEVDNFKKCIKYKDIIYLSVVTHEQFEGMEYKV